MKKTSYILILAAIGLSTGCKKYLDTLPDDRTVITTPEQVSKLLINAYPKATYAAFTETMSDNAEDKNNSGLNADPETYKINAEAYRYKDVQSTERDSPINYFYSCYKAIAAANQALTYCNGKDAERFTAQKGEALVARAYAHFMLVTLFSKAYDPVTAASDPGIPYVTTVETNVFEKYDRKTVQYVYDMIEKDLNVGVPLIDERIYADAPKYHFNLKATNAFLTRFYMFKRDYAKAIQYADAVLGATPASYLRNQTTFKAMQYEEQIALYANARMPFNLLVQEADTRWYNNSFPYYRFGFGTAMYEKFFTGKNATGGSFNSNVYTGAAHTLNLPKLNGFNAGSGIYCVMPLFSGDEVFFNRVEALIATNNVTKAETEMQTWMALNMTGGSTTGAVEFFKQPNTAEGKKNAMLQLCLYLKQQSYLEEGLRWFDILRLKMPITHKVLGEATVELAADDLRKVLQLPQEAVAAGLPLNPR